LSNVNPAAPDGAAILRLIQASKAAGAAGRESEADQLLAHAAQAAPAHPAVLNELGLRMMLRNEAAKARELFRRFPKAAYQTEIETWRVLPGDRIEFTVRRLPSAD